MLEQVYSNKIVNIIKKWSYWMIYKYAAEETFNNGHVKGCCSPQYCSLCQVPALFQAVFSPQSPD